MMGIKALSTNGAGVAGYLHAKDKFGLLHTDTHKN